VFAPSRLRRFSHHAAALLGADVSPASRAEANSGSLNRFWRQLVASEIKELDREIEQSLRRKAGATHETSQAQGAPSAQDPREFYGQI
jgi:hypothetical protein